jgi:long-subunit acyl-CoA synthetase (AMP-forming)
VPAVSLTQGLLNYAARGSERTAVSDDRQRISRSDLVQLVTGAAADLAGTSQTIGISGDNSVEWMVAFLAASALGKTVVPIPSFFSREQSAHIVADAGIGLILEAPGLPDSHRGLGPASRPILLRRESGCCIPNETGGLIIYTSGSTGRPKGVRLCSGQALWSAQALAKASRASAEDRYLSILPLSLLLELICGIIIPVLVGGTVHYDAACARALAGGTPADIAGLIQAERPTTTVMVPQLLSLYVAQLLAAGSRAPVTLRFVAIGGAPVPSALSSAALRLGVPLFEGYGLSECCSVVAVNRPGATRAGSVGQPLEGLRVQIEDGEIVVEGPSLMDGYLHEDSLPPFRWRTGDFGSLDKDGFLTVHGRRDNLIITASGRNINPEWVETALLDEANFAACVVGPIGEPTELSVLLIPSEAAADWGTSASRREVLGVVERACHGLPSYARPKSAFVISHPEAIKAGLFTPNGRIRRRVALELLSARARIVNQHS